MTLANQPDPLPSNKVIAFAAVTILYHHFSGAAVPPEVAEAYGVFIQIGLGLAAAWFVPDRMNIPRG